MDSSIVLERKFNPSAGKNKDPILLVLKEQIERAFGSEEEASLTLLEIASGVGEHAGYFLENIPAISRYQPTDVDFSTFDSIVAWTSVLADRSLKPFVFDMLKIEEGISHLQNDCGIKLVNVMICINLIHISPFQCTHGLLQTADRLLSDDGFLLTYGPYRMNGEMVESNMMFNESLRSISPEWGVRDVEAIEEVARNNHLVLNSVIPMPANNFCLIFTRG